jgi:hypothetical protein
LRSLVKSSFEEKRDEIGASDTVSPLVSIAGNNQCRLKRPEWAAKLMIDFPVALLESAVKFDYWISCATNDVRDRAAGRDHREGGQTL